MKIVMLAVILFCVSLVSVNKAEARWNYNFWTLYCVEPAGDIDYDIGFDEPHKDASGKVVLDIRDSSFSEQLFATGQISETEFSVKVFKSLYGGRSEFRGHLKAQKLQNKTWNVSFKPALYNKQKSELRCKYY